MCCPSLGVAHVGEKTCLYGRRIEKIVGKKEEVAEAYRWANTQEDAQRIISHFEIGKSVADFFSPG